jgi:NTP pyrophosphatase (non-canonical NTP hydrolase)
MNSFEALQKRVIEWADARDILTEGTKLGQFHKTLEELDELYEGIQKNSDKEVEDAIGDIIVTLIIQAELWGMDTVGCLDTAYKDIKNRQGKMRNGIFYKDE